MSKKCTVCGKEIEDGATTCKFCGAPVPIQDNFLITTPGSPESKKIEKLLNTRNKITGLITLLIFILLQIEIKIFQNNNIDEIYALGTSFIFVVGFVTVLQWKSWDIKKEFFFSIIFIFLGFFFLWLESSKSNIIAFSDGLETVASNTAFINFSWILIALGIISLLITLWKKYH